MEIKDQQVSEFMEAGARTGAVSAHAPSPLEWAFLKEAKVSWLVPYLERIAGGEPTPVSEIEEEFKRRYGKPLPIRRFEE